MKTWESMVVELRVSGVVRGLRELVVELFEAAKLKVSRKSSCLYILAPYFCERKIKKQPRIV